MSEANKSLNTLGGHAYHNLKHDAQRAIAVSAALELIALNIQGAHSSGMLEAELNSLAAYTDKIQEALKVK